MSLEHGILGFLSMKPLSGYDIKKLFNMSAAYFWPADQTQIYKSLKKLTSEGLVEFKSCTPGLTVDRKVYQITDKGRQALIDWISNPSITDYISRSPQVMQLFFSGFLSRDEQLAFLDRQVRLNEDLLRKLKENFENNEEVFAEIVERPEGDRQLDSAAYAHRWGILRGEAYGKLLEEIRKDLMQQNNLI